MLTTNISRRKLIEGALTLSVLALPIKLLAAETDAGHAHNVVMQLIET